MLRIALPKGRMQEGIFSLLRDAGIHVKLDARGYRPVISLPQVEAKILKPQNIVEMLHFGSRDVGFAGADWVEELGANLVDVLDTGLDPVRVVAAAPRSLLVNGELPKRHIVVASEYRRLTEKWIADQGLDATVVRTFGATEVFPPDDADCIVDNTATGSTLRANQLDIIDELLKSSTRLYVHPAALKNPAKKTMIDNLVLLLSSVLEARRRVMLELNVKSDSLEAVVAVLPCMREPTVSPLHGGTGFAVKAAVPKDRLPELIPEIKAHGGTDLVVSSLSQIVP